MLYRKWHVCRSLNINEILTTVLEFFLVRVVLKKSRFITAFKISLVFKVKRPKKT
jgi:hypothetical protein